MIQSKRHSNPKPTAAATPGRAGLKQERLRERALRRGVSHLVQQVEQLEQRLERLESQLRVPLAAKK